MAAAANDGGIPKLVQNWVGLRFACHGAYLRVVIPPRGRKTTARCPTCGREVDVVSGDAGSSQRYFEVGT